MDSPPIPRPRPAAADAAFDKSKDTFSAESPDCPTGTCAEDECEKCRQSMIKALKGEEFEGGINGRSSRELSDASITTFGELNPREAKDAAAVASQQRESQAIAAMLYNRSNAVQSGEIPKGSNFLGGGKSAKDLSGVAGARGQFHGYKGGKKLLEELTKKPLKGEACRRQCQRWKASKAAVEKFAKDPASLDQFNQDNGKFYYNRAIRQGSFTRTLNEARGEVRIGGNDFSELPMGTDAR